MAHLFISKVIALLHQSLYNQNCQFKFLLPKSWEKTNDEFWLVITLVSHTRGPRFEPGLRQSYSSHIFVYS
ncbi:hypothetical protein JHK82_026224 [Glycine max]|nr:hypothetical protein JHK87_026165 [Glycine soja]KAG5014089.1 hypothetical protein JHK86_026350 [Glycine max]KAG5135036.1 hypothetical protein JHK82_026224 [Glycine max]KHN29361.1 hypothetical protein glysoja_005085 [Glycine soja]